MDLIAKVLELLEAVLSLYCEFESKGQTRITEEREMERERGQARRERAVINRAQGLLEVVQAKQDYEVPLPLSMTQERAGHFPSY